MLGGPIVGTNSTDTAVVIVGFQPEKDQFLSAAQARQYAADLIRNAERVEKQEAMKSQQNLNMTGRRS